MQSIMKKTTAPVMLLIVALAGVVAYQSFAIRQDDAAGARPAPTQPPLVVWIDFGRVFDNVRDLVDGEQDLEAIRVTFENRRQALDEEVKRLERELLLLEKGSKEYKAAEQQLLDTVVELSAQIEFTKTKLGFERMMIRKRMFERARDESAKFADANGYHYVLVSDAGFPVEPGTEVQVMLDIANRRIMFAHPDYDVTEEFIKWMNAAP